MFMTNEEFEYEKALLKERVAGRISVLSTVIVLVSIPVIYIYAIYQYGRLEEQTHILENYYKIVSPFVGVVLGYYLRGKLQK